MRVCLLLLSLALPACTWISTDEIAGREDPDGDGARLDDDCAPQDPDWQVPATIYLDEDGDGHGDASTEMTVCEDVAGAIATADDCDDADPDRYPGATELCGDGVVNDCGATAEQAFDACGLREPEPVSTAALAELSGAERTERVGYAVASGGDITGDGAPDLLIAAPGDSATAGAVWVAPASVSGSNHVASVGFSLAGQAGQLAGLGLSDARDLDGDGYDDLLIGGPARASYDGGACGVGHAWLMLGPVAAAAVTGADATFTSVTGTDCAGHGVALAGDLTGDGEADLIVGAPSLNDGDHVGTAYVVSGPEALADPELSANAIALEGLTGRLAGYRVLGADLDGDGVSEAVVGAQGGSGGVYVVSGPITEDGALEDSVALASTQTEPSGAKAGSAFATPGDLDGDGIDDLIIGARLSAMQATEGGAAFVVLGPFTTDVTLETGADAVLLGAAEHDHAGVSVGGLGDVDQDGTGDVFVSAPECDLEASDGGVVYLVRGPWEGERQLSDEPAAITGVVASGWLGRGASRIADVNSDGVNDLLLGAPGDDSGTVIGSAWIWPVESF